LARGGAQAAQALQAVHAVAGGGALLSDRRAAARATGRERRAEGYGDGDVVERTHAKLDPDQYIRILAYQRSGLSPAVGRGGRRGGGAMRARVVLIRRALSALVIASALGAGPARAQDELPAGEEATPPEEGIDAGEFDDYTKADQVRKKRDAVEWGAGIRLRGVFVPRP